MKKVRTPLFPTYAQAAALMKASTGNLPKTIRRMAAGFQIGAEAMLQKLGEIIKPDAYRMSKRHIYIN